MRTVLYTNAMEPITVVDLPEWSEIYLLEQGMVRLAVVPPLQISDIWAREVPLCPNIRTVTIRAERLIRRGLEYTLLFTEDEESAMLLKCAFLPGQISEVQKRERIAFAKGFVDALMKVGR